MKVFRQFDYFRKTTSPESIKPTFLGGMISLGCIATIIFLIFNEWIVFQAPEIKKNMTVSTDPDKHPHIEVNLDIIFPNTPCYMLDIQIKTEVNVADKLNLIKSLSWSHLSQEG